MMGTVAKKGGFDNKGTKSNQKEEITKINDQIHALKGERKKLNEGINGIDSRILEGEQAKLSIDNDRSKLECEKKKI